jgi:hypothetical protein
MGEWSYESKGNFIIIGPKKMSSRNRSKIPRLNAITLPEMGFQE